MRGFFLFISFIYSEYSRAGSLGACTGGVVDGAGRGDGEKRILKLTCGTRHAVEYS